MNLLKSSRITLFTLTFILILCLSGCGYEDHFNIPEPQVYAGTPVPVGEIITPENTDQLIEIARWGKGQIYEIAWSPDGEIFAAATSIGIYFYDGNTFEQTDFLPTIVGVDAMAFSPDSSLLAVGDDFPGGNLWLLDIESKTTKRFFQGNAFIEAIEFSPDGTSLAFSDGNEINYLFSIETGKRVLDLPRTGYSIDDLAFSSDGILLYAADYKSIIVYEISKGSIINQWETSNRFATISLSSDDKILAINGCGADDDRGWCLEGEVWLWNTDTWELEKTLKGHEGRVNDIDFSPGGSLLITVADDDQDIHIWDPNTGNEITLLSGHTSGIEHVSFSPDGELIASASKDGTIRFWSVENYEQVFAIEGFSDRVESLTISPNGELIAVNSFDFTKVLQTSTGDEILQIDYPFWSFTNMAIFSENSERVAVASAAEKASITMGVVQAWDIEQEKSVYFEETPGFFDFRFDPNNNLLIALKDGDIIDTPITIGITDNESENIQEVSFNDESVHNLNLSEKESLLPLGYPPEGPVKLWFFQDGQPQFIFGNIYPEQVNDLAISVNNLLLAGTSDDKTVYLWDLTTGEMLHQLEGHTWWVYCVAFSPDGKLLASGSRDQTILIWDTTTGELLHKISNHSEAITALAFTPDGKYLVSGSDDGTVRFWGVEQE